MSAARISPLNATDPTGYTGLEDVPSPPIPGPWSEPGCHCGGPVVNTRTHDTATNGRKTGEPYLPNPPYGGGPAPAIPRGERPVAPAKTVEQQATSTQAISPEAPSASTEITNPIAMAFANLLVKIICGAECSTANAPETASTPLVNALTTKQHLHNAYVTATTIYGTPGGKIKAAAIGALPGLMHATDPDDISTEASDADAEAVAAGTEAVTNTARAQVDPGKLTICSGRLHRMPITPRGQGRT